MAKAKWTAKDVKATVDRDTGEFTLQATIMDNGMPQVTPILTVTADRALRLLLKGEPGMTLTDFEARSDF